MIVNKNERRQKICVIYGQCNVQVKNDKCQLIINFSIDAESQDNSNYMRRIRATTAIQICLILRRQSVRRPTCEDYYNRMASISQQECLLERVNYIKTSKFLLYLPEIERLQKY